MSENEVRSFMREGSRTAKLATVRADGSPHVVPVWFDFDDATGDLVFLTGVGTVKGRNLARDPRASVAVDTMEMPFSFARLDGTATLTRHEDEPDTVARWAVETCRRYVGDDRAEEFGARNAVDGEALVRVRPERLVGEWGVAD